ncbi:MAG: phospholipase/carboxylesterase [Actinomycetota bacterium]|nr:phospholipase/carboxylesterase [Actinomycetota bacterium]
MTSDLDLLAYRERSVDEPQGAIVLLHGRGADENDLFPLFDILDPERKYVGVCPRGPLSLPPGGAHWYIVRRVGYPDPETFFPTFSAASRWLDAWLASKELSPERCIFGGFSQGCVMTYSLGLGKGRPRPAGLLCFSGFIPKVDGFEFDLSGLEGYPVAIGHGTYDPVIQVDFGREAQARLEGSGADVTYRESPMAHSIDPGYLGEMKDWVAGVLNA